ncbi:hypothetical protein LRS03_25945 [Rhizobacter sp. J219]|uniref:hypothetical protein n=1 Tax=Rhizobacter sp. J219 TaxID=2898430 RepID=UPI0021510060|nr:hypothetical protein [Rhizobacter sp. J219]MCR5886108.1 hypothetical protein [Rhizobacter sp. J219]
MSVAAAHAATLSTPESIRLVCQALRDSLTPFEVAKEAAFEHIKNGPGLYYIEVKFPFRTEVELTKFIQQWGAVRAPNNPGATARAYPSRAKKHLIKVKNGEFVPFYLGKHMQVRGRVGQHLSGLATSTTYGLKLLARSHLLDGCSFQVGAATFEIPRQAYFCVAFLEEGARKNLQPIIGKQ